MSEAIRARVIRLINECGPSLSYEFENPIYDFVLSEIGRAEVQWQSGETIQHRILRALEQNEQHQNERDRHIMIAIEKLKASSDALTDAVTGAIALIPAGTPASTPDAAVLAFQSDVEAQTSRLLAAEGPAPTPAPAPAPGA